MHRSCDQTAPGPEVHTQATVRVNRLRSVVISNHAHHRPDAESDALDQRASHTPGPLEDRLRGTAARLRGYADAHDRTCITLNQNNKDKDVAE